MAWGIAATAVAAGEKSISEDAARATQGKINPSFFSSMLTPGHSDCVE